MSQPGPTQSTAPLNVSHKSVLAIALPIMASNVSEPLIGIVDTWVIGRLPDATYIGAVAIGAMIFSFIFWGFGFLRMGTGGMTAQAVGARDGVELRAVLARALLIAGSCGLGLIALSPAIESVSFWVIGASENVEVHARKYFEIRIFAAPFSLANYVFLGWFIGLGKARTAFFLQLLLNISNMLLDAYFVLVMGMTSDGVALGTVGASFIASVAGAWAVQRELKRRGGVWSWPSTLNPSRLKRTVAVNADIMVRSLALVFAFSWFTAQGAKSGDTVLAANAILMNIMLVGIYLIDGFAFSAETLVGQAVGARSIERFRASVKMSTLWAYAVAALLSLGIYITGDVLIDALTVNQDVRETARDYLPWAALCPVIGVGCFQLDGIFIGATQTSDMRNMMLVSLALYIAAWWVLTPLLGNHGLWISLLVFFIVRGVTLWLRMPAIERDRFSAQPENA